MARLAVNVDRNALNFIKLITIIFDVFINNFLFLCNFKRVFFIDRATATLVLSYGLYVSEIWINCINNNNHLGYLLTNSLYYLTCLLLIYTYHIKITIQLAVYSVIRRFSKLTGHLQGEPSLSIIIK